MSVDDILPNAYPAADDPYATRSMRIHMPISSAGDMPAAVGSGEAPRRTRARPPRFVRWTLNVIVAVLVLLLVAIPTALYLLDRRYTEKIYPNVRIAGVSVGEMRPDQARAALEARYGAFLAQPLTLTYDGHVWKPEAQKLGVWFDLSAAVQQAYGSGRGHGLVNDLREITAIYQNGLDVPVAARLDQRAVQQVVRQISAELERAPVDATLRLNGTTVETSAAVTGLQVDIDQTVREASDALATITPQTVAVRTRELAPRLSDAAVADGQKRIEAFLNGSLTLNVDKRAYVLTPADIALVLDIARMPQDSATDRIAVAVNKLQVDRRIRKMTDETGRGSVNPRVAWNNGNLTITKPGQTGLRLDEAQARAMMLAWTGAERTLALPVNVVQPQVTAANLDTLGIRELVSVGRSDFTGSAEYRINNIGVGMKKFTGLLIAPNEEFSFNENVGSIDAENGFVEGYAIIQNRTQLEFGGGICQDSTTMFRAAFWAGLPITERWGHTFYISWYNKYGLGAAGDGPGMDATIFTGGPDLKFVNDTGHWLLLESDSDPANHVAEVRFYGTKPNRTVDIRQEVVSRKPAIEQPEFIADRAQPRGTAHRTDTKRGGMTINVYRTITENGVARKPQRFQTVFKPWADKYAINPADMGKNGRPLIWGPWAPRPQPQPQPPVADPNAQPAPAPAPAPQG